MSLISDLQKSPLKLKRIKKKKKKKKNDNNNNNNKEK